MVRPFRWDSERKVLHLLDQRRLPSEQVWIECAEASQVAHAIREMAIRGAPAIGIAAAYAVVIGFARDGSHERGRSLRGVRRLAVQHPPHRGQPWGGRPPDARPARDTPFPSGT